MDGELVDRRPRGRPRGAATKPYIRRVPKVVGMRLPSARSDELSPGERVRVGTFLDSDALQRMALQQQARLGCYSAQQLLYDRYRLRIMCTASLQSVPTSLTSVFEPLERPVVYILKPLFDFS